MSLQISVLFTYNGVQTEIKCLKSDKLRDIFKIFNSKVELDNTKKYYYFYNNNEISDELKVEDLINEKDGEVDQIKILVEEENIKDLNEIVCPDCGEAILIKINDYRINCLKCKNNHFINNISIKELNNILKMDITEIECDECKIRNKGNISDFYKCLKCKNNLCPSCKSKHDKDHIKIEYDKINVICNIHNCFYVKYCKECNKNICLKCLQDHLNHNTINFEDLMPRNENNKELKNYIDKLENIIDDLVKKLTNIKDNLKIYYDISNNLINNNNINYEILKNMNEFINNNNKIIKDIKEILDIDDNNINEKFKNLMNMYNKIIDKNYITAEIDIKKEDLNKDIRIINSFEQSKRENTMLTYGNYDYKYENEKDIKENCKIKINNKIILPFPYFYKFTEIGKYQIIYTFENKLKNLDYMFNGCQALTNIDLSNFITQNATNMSNMFDGCQSLTTINLTNLETKNVKNMRNMFSNCKSLKEINLSNFNTENVTNTSWMFSGCESLTSLNLSNFNTENVNNMKYMFSECRNLKRENVITKDKKILNLFK